MGTTNWCLGRGRLGSFETNPRHSDTENPDSFLCPGMTGRLPLKRFGASRYKQCVEAAIEYVKLIDDFDDLVDPHTLALYCLGPEPSAFVLRTIEIEEKKSKYFI